MQMKETVRRVKTCLPYGMLLTVLFKFYKVDLKNEEGKKLHHTDVYSSDTLKRMGYKEVEKVWRKKSTNERAIGSSSSEEEEEEEEEEEPADTSTAPETQPGTAATGSPLTDLPTADLPEPEIELNAGFGFEGPLPDLPSTSQPPLGQFQMEDQFKKLSESLTSTMTSLFTDFKGSVDNRLCNLEEKVTAIQEKVDRFESSKTAPPTDAPPASIQPIVDTISSHTEKLQNSVDNTLNQYNEELRELKYKMGTFTESVRMEDDYTKGVGIIRSELGRLRGSAEAFANVQAGELISMQKEIGQMKEDVHKVPICFNNMNKQLQSIWAEMLSLSGSVRALQETTRSTPLYDPQPVSFVPPPSSSHPRAPPPHATSTRGPRPTTWYKNIESDSD